MNVFLFQDRRHKVNIHVDCTSPDLNAFSTRVRLAWDRSPWRASAGIPYRLCRRSATVAASALKTTNTITLFPHFGVAVSPSSSTFGDSGASINWEGSRILCKVSTRTRSFELASAFTCTNFCVMVLGTTSDCNDASPAAVTWEKPRQTAMLLRKRSNNRQHAKHTYCFLGRNENCVWSANHTVHTIKSTFTL